MIVGNKMKDIRKGKISRTEKLWIEKSTEPEFGRFFTVLLLNFFANSTKSGNNLGCYLCFDATVKRTAVTAPLGRMPEVGSAMSLSTAFVLNAHAILHLKLLVMTTVIGSVSGAANVTSNEKRCIFSVVIIYLYIVG